MDSQENVTISVALVTYNLPDYLNRCLESIRAQSVQPYEIVVSDDSTPDIAPQNEAIALKWGCRYITGPRRGLQANLNNAAIACQGTHVRIVNDDHLFPDNHFQIIYDTVSSLPESIWLLGEYYEYPNPESHLHLPGEVQPRGFHKPISNFDDCFAISGGCAIIPRKIFETHRFLEAFGYICDLEFGPRLHALGYRIRYCPDTYVIHLSHGTVEERIEKHKIVYPKGAFLLSYLAYSSYRPDVFSQMQCLAYFLYLAMLTSLNIKNYNFRLLDFWQTWQMAREYGKLFQEGKYEKMI
ncbi:glycosyltransferase family 2 protein [Roseofilum casamattae]|uniref:Glycosyltransferase family 2 protein n=1 Tax=Roseofilum casamattae BLCC-M143 TaxID=3022442 RepID=A0ABT7C0W2_9CYAN|nr:glycosyltransferase family 2 protein [Roseofilum casamattae]MDJ1185079.1 glycosyltransferase family 2 protein [Roseofilum casamattae BLCC-M143]